PSRPNTALARYALATDQHIDLAVACARADPDGWRTRTVSERNSILGRAAQEIRKARATLMWAALANGGKILSESDPEVSEAVDFVEFYRASARFFQALADTNAAGAGAGRTFQVSPRGVVVIVPPWNFPIAIPCGGIAAALASGNTAILKPASDA